MRSIVSIKAVLLTVLANVSFAAGGIAAAFVAQRLLWPGLVFVLACTFGLIRMRCPRWRDSMGPFCSVACNRVYSAPEGPPMEPKFLPDVEQNSQPGPYRALIEQVQAQRMEYPQIWYLFAYLLRVTEHLARFTQEILRGSAPLSPGMRELIAAYILEGKGITTATPLRQVQAK